MARPFGRRRIRNVFGLPPSAVPRDVRPSRPKPKPTPKPVSNPIPDLDTLLREKPRRKR